MLQTPDGGAQLLQAPVGLPIGVADQHHRYDETVTVPTGSTLLFCTDGLVETRDGDIDQDLARLTRAVAAHVPSEGPSALVERLLQEQTSSGDDVAVLAVRLGAQAAVEAVSRSTAASRSTSGI